MSDDHGRMPDHSPSPTRSAVLVLPLAVVPLPDEVIAEASPEAITASEGDAELLAVCKEFMASHAVVEAWDAGAVTEEVGEAAYDRRDACLRKIKGIPAWTWEGVQAKAAVAHQAVWAFRGFESDSVDDLVAYVLVEVATWPSERGRA